MTEKLKKQRTQESDIKRKLNIKIFKNTIQVKKILIELDNIAADMLSNKKLSRGRKLYISFVSITQSYFVVPENITLNSANYFIMKIPNKSLNKSYLIINWILTFKTVLCEFL